MTITNIYYLHEIGNKKKQEDYLWPATGTATLNDRVFIICDGVGGSQNGEVASKIIAEYVGNALITSPNDQLSAEHITTLLYQAKDELIGYARENGLNQDMATTLSLLVLQPHQAFIAWCGDSRVYHVRAGNILYQTEDHSLVHTLVKNGEITEEEAQHHPHKNIILQAVKADEDIIEIATHVITGIQDGDYFLLCTDGLLEQISAHDLQGILQSNSDQHKDIVARFLEKCFGKTRDNYSMYLLQTGITRREDAARSPKNVYIFLLLLVLSASGLFVFFMRQKTDTFQPKLKVKATDSATLWNMDSTLFNHFK
jgi:serine/threonine protein phosphatase PrpC